MNAIRKRRIPRPLQNLLKANPAAQIERGRLVRLVDWMVMVLSGCIPNADEPSALHELCIGRILCRCCVKSTFVRETYVKNG